MCKTAYKHDYNKYKKKDCIAGIQPVFNLEIEEKRVYTKIKTKNNFKAESKTTTAT
jgi:hypothetical protein